MTVGLVREVWAASPAAAVEKRWPQSVPKVAGVSARAKWGSVASDGLTWGSGSISVGDVQPH